MLSIKDFMRIFKLIFILSISLIASCSAAGNPAIDPAGTWRFEKAVDYSGEEVTSHRYDTIQIVDGRLILSLQCTVSIKRDDYTFAGAFQLMLKDGVSSAQLNKFIKKNFSLDLATARDVYSVDGIECSKPFGELIVFKDRLLVNYASTLFHSYARVQTKPANTQLVTQKLSTLPFNIAAYKSGCDIPTVKKIPQTTTKCAPIYYPYVASKGATDRLSTLIGAHNYAVGSLKDSTAYNNPLKHDLNLVYLVFSPRGEVLLVRVDDFESGENSDPMGGVYLAIKDGQVTDQIDLGCNMTMAYLCVDDAGKEQARLLSNGRFSRNEIVKK